ncbi:crotonobetaine/carnitine-CoA ligase [Desulfuromusa kysingii]|uniref:Crotonobetaine/carnitine-CoA ligase n=1 Tax=Desulfuromusa kysingii TaxID=37625 RepID=A0A1H4C791_9BACT|nr:crotonobetaine/carnitine-CoA ligase [Desulfuromusa kysingii]SEA56219.1 crotonobetaine/carnitine-CoA ligase [Desulfuromusa kysingii]
MVKSEFTFSSSSRIYSPSKFDANWVSTSFERQIVRLNIQFFIDSFAPIRLRIKGKKAGIIMTVKMNTRVDKKNIGDLWEERFKLDKDNLFMIYETREGSVSQFTYGDTYTNIIKAANLFLSLGLEKGDLVAVQLYNSPEFLYAMFGLMRIGAIIVPMNVHYTNVECRYIMDKCKVSILLTEEKFLDLHEKIDCSHLKHRILARSDREVDGYLNFAKELSRQTDTLKEHRELHPGDVAEVLFTSGTTSMPKGATFTHYNLLYAGEFHANQMALTSDDRFFTVFPCFHIDWQAIAVMPILTKGAVVVVQEQYHATKFWQQIRDYKITIAEAIPMIIRTLMLQPKAENERKHSLRLMYFSLCMSTEEKESFENRYNVKLFNCYGLTETIVCNIADVCTGEARWPSVGKTYDPYKIKIVDDNNDTLPATCVGEICLKGVRGENLILGYYNDEQETYKLYDDNDWLHTGDKGFLDEDGWLYFVDRKNNLIKRSGENISASEVENVLTSHSFIEEAAVVGVPDPIREQAVKAYVKFYEGKSLEIEDIRQFCSDRLASFKVPEIIEIVEDFKHTCTGKIQKKNLKGE